MPSRTSLPHICHRLLRMTLLPLAALLVVGAAPVAQSQAFDTLHSFDGPGGSSPYAAVIQGKNGFLYGTTYRGGADDAGTLFRVSPDGTGFLTLHAFNKTDGGNVSAAVIQSSDGTLYGTTSGYGNQPNGTVFRVNPDGTGFLTLHAFDGSDGSNPLAALLLGADGALYGTTAGNEIDDAGTLFRVNPNGTGFRTLHVFSKSDGAYPDAALIQGKEGALYGTTYQGSDSNAGTLFRINPDGTGFLTLHTFSGAKDGGNPYTGVIQGKDGALYGTTQNGGASNDGILFKVNPDGANFQTLTNFNDNDGNSHSAVTQASDGALYGTNAVGGKFMEGTVFKVNPDGTNYLNLHVFDGSTEQGTLPFASVIQGKDGALYGTTDQGGSFMEGTVFRLALTVQIANVSIAPAAVIGGQQNATGTVRLDGPAPAGGALVTLTSSNTGAATVPASVTVPAGKATATFTVTTKKVPANVTSRITATYKGVSQTTTLMVTPVPILVTSLGVSPNPAVGGQQNPTGTVTLSYPAPTGGAVVSLTSANTGAATVPASLIVPAGATSATFTVTTKKVPATVTTRITATLNGSQQQVVLTVTH